MFECAGRNQSRPEVPIGSGLLFVEKLMAARIASILQKVKGPAADRLNVVFN